MTAKYPLATEGRQNICQMMINAARTMQTKRETVGTKAKTLQGERQPPPLSFQDDTSRKKAAPHRHPTNKVKAFTWKLTGAEGTGAKNAGLYQSF
jgi:hypothetical protein